MCLQGISATIQGNHGQKLKADMEANLLQCQDVTKTYLNMYIAYLVVTSKPKN